jgi:hypothetical protein
MSQLDLDETLRIYVRPEGSHLVALCAELRAIVSGSTVEEIIEKTRVSIPYDFRFDPHFARVAVQMGGPSANTPSPQ